jgi:alkanesulfonate monooxygenase SsuD/methylene tetrahydromethanopterin reductase-like flavin-dependent oxidoreductase (luciferase family)
MLGGLLVDIGVFIPIGNNGWLISKEAPQYKPTFELNKEIVQKAESYGFDFALSMVKLRGFGGDTEHWDYNLESFTLMAGLAAVTEKIKLFASTPAASASTSSPAGPRPSTPRWDCGRAIRITPTAMTTAPNT